MPERRAALKPWIFPLSTACLLAALGASLPEPSAAAPSSGSALCRLQEPKEFLKRRYFVRRGQLDGRRNERSLKFRVEKYGTIPGIGIDALAPLGGGTAFSNAATTHFFGLPVSVHRAVIPALRCVERRIRKTCTDAGERYTPQALGGFRQLNTFRGGEVSNHLFGIAIDIDPDRNPCCGCVEPWPTHPACQGDASTVYERTALPRCWIRAFERYGFYWLGNDPQLRDTMHFEFLGDPKRILAP